MKRFVTTILAIVMIAATTGCGNSQLSQNESASTPSSSGTSTSTGSDASPETTQSVITRGGHLTTSRIGITPLNPLKYLAFQGDKILLGFFFDSLLQMNENLELEPLLAESWEVSDDSKQITLRLKEGVKYFDGTEMTAETVKYCWDWYLDPETNGNFYGQINACKLVEAVDKYTIRFHFDEPDSGFLAQLTYQAGYPLAPSAIDEYKATGDDTIFAKKGGTGAFILSEQIEGVSTTGERNPNYHLMGEDGQPLPYLDKITVTIIADESVASANLISGDIHAVDNILLPATMQQIDSSGVAHTHDIGPMMWWISLNVTQPPFDNQKVRQAFDYAFNRQELIDVIGLGEGLITPWMILPTQSYYKDVPTTEYNPAKAKELLAEVGYPDGINVDFYYGTFGLLPTEAELCQAQAKEAGFNLNLVGLDGATVKTMWYQNSSENPAGARLWFGYMPKQTAYVQIEYQTGKDALQNNSRWFDDEYQELLSELKITFDEAKTREIVSRMQDIALEQMPMVMLQCKSRKIAFGNAAHGIFVDNDGAMNFRAAWLES